MINKGESEMLGLQGLYALHPSQFDDDEIENFIEKN